MASCFCQARGIDVKYKHTGDVRFKALVGQYMALTAMLPTRENWVNTEMTLSAALESIPFDRDELLNQKRILEEMLRDLELSPREASKLDIALWMAKAYLLVLDDRVDFKR